jgi:hypothetical protein
MGAVALHCWSCCFTCGQTSSKLAIQRIAGTAAIVGLKRAAQILVTVKICWTLVPGAGSR